MCRPYGLCYKFKRCKKHGIGPESRPIQKIGRLVGSIMPMVFMVIHGYSVGRGEHYCGEGER